MQAGLPLQAAKQAARLSTVGVAIGAGEPAGTPFIGAAWVPTWEVEPVAPVLVEPVAGFFAAFPAPVLVP